jgi:hypothetical protein
MRWGNEIQSAPIQYQNDTGSEQMELFLNNLEGEVVAIIPNVTPFSSESDYGGD